MTEPEAQQWMREAAKEYHDRHCPRHANSCADCVIDLMAIIARHAPAAPSQTRQPPRDAEREFLRAAMMKHFSDKLSMDEIGNLIYDVFPVEAAPQTRQSAGFVSDTLYDGPSCTQCGAAMVYKCLSCGNSPELASGRESAESEQNKAAKISETKSQRMTPSLRNEPLATETRQSQWISVSEKLPDIEEEVLVFCSEAREDGGGIFVDHRPGLAGEEWDTAGGNRLTVTHWMPLPAYPDQSQPKQPAETRQSAESWLDAWGQFLLDHLSGEPISQRDTFEAGYKAGVAPAAQKENQTDNWRKRELRRLAKSTKECHP
jgi:hypothetical protein